MAFISEVIWKEKNSTKSENLIVFIFSLIVVGYFTYNTKEFRLDDALIYLRYIRNYMEGYGLVYNIGERFNALTSPLYSYFLVLSTFISSNLQLNNILISGIFLLFAVYIAALVFGNNIFEKLSIVLVVGSFNYFYFTFGMETSLFLFLSMLSLYLYMYQRYYLLGLSLGLLFLTRGEGVFLSLVIVAHYLYSNKALPSFKYFVLPAVLVLANFIFNYYYYGTLLPETSSAKIGQGKSGFWGTDWIFFNIQYMYGWFFGGGIYYLLLTMFFAAIGLIVLIKEKSFFIFFVFTLCVVLFYGLLNIPNYHWYYASIYLLLLVLVSKGVIKALMLPLSLVGLFRKFFFIIPAILFAYFIYNGVLLTNRASGPFWPYRDIGLWMDKNLPKDASVGAVEIGHIGWFSKRYIIDILGLVNKYNADYIANGDVYSWLGKYQPDYILVHDPLWGWEVTATTLLEKKFYSNVENFHYRGYKLIKLNKKKTNEIKNYFSNYSKTREIYKALYESSTKKGPFVLIEHGNMLFAHAPSALQLSIGGLDILKDKTSLSFVYGVKKGAKDLHKGICFFVYKNDEKRDSLIMQDCFKQGVVGEREFKINLDAEMLEKIIFVNKCSKGCNNAWSYWGKFDTND